MKLDRFPANTIDLHNLKFHVQICLKQIYILPESPLKPFVRVEKYWKIRQTRQQEFIFMIVA